MLHFYYTRQKVHHYPFDLSSDSKKCTHLKLAAVCLYKTNQEKLLTKATPLHFSVCPSTVVTTWIRVKRPITIAPGFEVTIVSWWSKSLKFSLLSSFYPTFTSLSATTQGLFERRKSQQPKSPTIVYLNASDSIHVVRICANIFVHKGTFTIISLNT